MECLIPVPGLPTWLLFTWGMLVYLCFMLWRTGTYKTLSRQSEIQHRLGAAVIFLAILWHIRYELDYGPAFHFLGVTFITLVLRGNLAILAGILAMTILALLNKSSWPLLPLNIFVVVIIPVMMTVSIVELEKRIGFRSFFGFIFFNGFFGAAMVMAVSMLTGALACWGLSASPWTEDHTLLLAYLPLIIFPEGVINGMLVTGLMVYFPHLLATFDPRRYQ